MKKFLFVFLMGAALLWGAATFAATATFDDLPITVPPATAYSGPGGGAYYNGSDGAGGFASGGADFVNNYNTTWGTWDGWSYSNTTDTTTSGFGNQYSAYTGGAHSGTQYGVFFEAFGATAPTVRFSSPVNLTGAYLTNTTYVALAMLNGDSFSKKFDAGDWFKLTIWGFDAAGAQTNSLDFYLADYRDSDPANWYILNIWTDVDLSSLGVVSGLGFDLDSSDVGQWGMNTPAYFAMDDLSFQPVPIPGVMLLLLSGQND